MKLWKGLFYCMWMSDKPRNQQQLARDLAGLIEVVPKDTVIPFLDTFWKTMAREWGGIPQLRYASIAFELEHLLNYRQDGQISLPCTAISPWLVPVSGKVGLEGHNGD